MRYFIAIDFPKEIIEELSHIQKRLRYVAPNLKYVSPENVHLTLAFLGEVKNEKIQDIKGILERIVQKHIKIKCRLQNVGIFPNFNYIRVIWVGLEEDKEILNLQREIVNKINIKTNKDFSSHITIARVKTRLDNKIINKIKDLNKFKGEKFEVNKIKLKKSTLTSKGPIYEDITVFKLSE